MTSVLNVDTIADKAGTGPVALTKQDTIKAWAKFDQNTENDLEDSFNTSSISDESTGRAYWNNTNAFANTNGMMAGATARTGNPKLSGVSGVIMRSTSQWDINTTQANGDALVDSEWGSLGVGDLA